MFLVMPCITIVNAPVPHGRCQLIYYPGFDGSPRQLSTKNPCEYPSWMAGFDKFLKIILKNAAIFLKIFFSKIIFFCEGTGASFWEYLGIFQFFGTIIQELQPLKNEASEVMNHRQFWKLTFLRWRLWSLEYDSTLAALTLITVFSQMFKFLENIL